jgi:hypothetical protein
MLALVAVAAIFGTVAYVVLDSRRAERPLPDIREPADIGGAVMVDVFTARDFDAVVAGVDPRVFVGADDNFTWPDGWKKPSQTYLLAAKEAAAKYDVPIENIFAITRKESADFSPKARGRQLLKSYNRVKNKPIPGGNGLTWGDKYAPEEWHAYGIMQVLPFNLYGIPGLLKASAPKDAAFDTRINVLAGTRVLRQLFDKLGNWEDAIWKYNGSKGYMREVLAYRNEFRAAQVA